MREEDARAERNGEDEGYAFVTADQYFENEKAPGRRRASRVWEFVKFLRGDLVYYSRDMSDKSKRTHVRTYEFEGKAC